MMKPHDDAHLVERARAGERAAFARLLERYQHSLHAFVVARIGGGHDADDLAQEVFVAAWRNLASLERPDSFAGWLFGIARTKLRMHYRRQARQRLSADPALDRFPAPAPESSGDGLERLLEPFADDVRAVLLLRFRDGLRYREIGARLGIPAGTVGTILHRACARLRGRAETRKALS